MNHRLSKDIIVTIVLATRPTIVEEPARKMRSNKSSCRGAALVEYAIALALLISAFVLAGQFLSQAASSRGERSAQTASSLVPCISTPLPGNGSAEGLAQIGGDACK